MVKQSTLAPKERRKELSKIIPPLSYYFKCLKCYDTGRILELFDDGWNTHLIDEYCDCDWQV